MPLFTAEKFTDKVVVQNLVPNIEIETERLYGEVVERCFFARDHLSGQEAGQLMSMPHEA